MPQSASPLKDPLYTWLGTQVHFAHRSLPRPNFGLPAFTLGLFKGPVTAPKPRLLAISPSHHINLDAGLLFHATNRRKSATQSIEPGDVRQSCSLCPSRACVSGNAKSEQSRLFDSSAAQPTSPSSADNMTIRFAEIS